MRRRRWSKRVYLTLAWRWRLVPRQTATQTLRDHNFLLFFSFEPAFTFVCLYTNALFAVCFVIIIESTLLCTFSQYPLTPLHQVSGDWLVDIHGYSIHHPHLSSTFSSSRQSSGIQHSPQISILRIVALHLSSIHFFATSSSNQNAAVFVLASHSDVLTTAQLSKTFTWLHLANEAPESCRKIWSTT